MSLSSWFFLSSLEDRNSEITVLKMRSIFLCFFQAPRTMPVHEFNLVLLLPISLSLSLLSEKETERSFSGRWAMSRDETTKRLKTATLFRKPVSRLRPRPKKAVQNGRVHTAAQAAFGSVKRGKRCLAMSSNFYTLSFKKAITLSPGLFS